MPHRRAQLLRRRRAARPAGLAFRSAAGRSLGRVSWQSRTAKRASRFLKPGERVQAVFCANVTNTAGMVVYFPAFVVTDRAIIEIDRQTITGRLTRVVARHPRNIRLGPLSRTFGGGYFTLDNVRYWVPKRLFKEVAAADAFRPEQAPEPGDSVAAPRQIPQKTWLRAASVLMGVIGLLLVVSPFIDPHPALRNATAFLVALLIFLTPLVAVSWFSFRALRGEWERHHAGAAAPQSLPHQHLLRGLFWMVGGFLAGVSLAGFAGAVAGPPVPSVAGFGMLVVWAIYAAVGLREVFLATKLAFRRRVARAALQLHLTEE